MSKSKKERVKKSKPTRPTKNKDGLNEKVSFLKMLMSDPSIERTFSIANAKIASKSIKNK